METTGQKKVWTGSERVVGYIIALALLVGVSRGLYLILPSLIALVTNLVTFLALVFGTVIVCGVIISNRKMISIGYQIIIKKVWSALINSDPIAIKEILCNKWQKDLNEQNNNITTLQSSELDFVNTMKQNEKEAEELIKEGKASEQLAISNPNQKDQYLMKASQNSVMAKSRLKSNEDLKPKLDFIRAALKISKRIYVECEGDLVVLRDDIVVKKRILKALSKTNSVFKMASSYINGNSNERIMFDEAERSYNEQVSEHFAKIKRFTETTKDWAMNRDIKDSINLKEGQAFLSTYNENTLNELQNNFKKLIEENREQNTLLQTSENIGKFDTSTVTSSNFDTLK